MIFGCNKGCKSHNPLIYTFIAEREGFEPPVPLSTAVFKTAVIDHSTISPFSRLTRWLLVEKRCKDKGIFGYNKGKRHLFYIFLKFS